MRAVISGRSGVAILIEGDEIRYIDLERTQEPRACSPRDLRFLLADARDLIFYESDDLDAIRQQLADARASDDALQLALFMIDADLSRDTREAVALDLEELLVHSVVMRFVEGVLYAHPCPRSADLVGALDIAQARSCPRVRCMFEELAETQKEIGETWLAWERLPSALFEDDRAQTRVAFVRAGMFRTLAGARREGTQLDPSMLAVSVPTVRRARQILEHWLNSSNARRSMDPDQLLEHVGSSQERVAFFRNPKTMGKGGPANRLGSVNAALSEEFASRVMVSDPWRALQELGPSGEQRVELLRDLFFAKLDPDDAPAVVIRMLVSCPSALHHELYELLTGAGVRVEMPLAHLRRSFLLGLYRPEVLGQGQIAHRPLKIPDQFVASAIDYCAYRPMHGCELQLLEIAASNMGADVSES